MPPAVRVVALVLALVMIVGVAVSIATIGPGLLVLVALVVGGFLLFAARGNPDRPLSVVTATALFAFAILTLDFDSMLASPLVAAHLVVLVVIVIALWRRARHAHWAALAYAVIAAPYFLLGTLTWPLRGSAWTANAAQLVAWTLVAALLARPRVRAYFDAEAAPA